MFEYEFVRIAFLVGTMLAIALPLIGTNIVLKRLSMTGDALSHTSLAGIAIGLILGVNPLPIAMLTCVVAALIIELIRKKFYKYSEIAIAIVLSGGIGLAGVLSSFTPIANFSSYLFGSIVSISMTELFLTIGVFAVVVITSIIFYKELMFISYNENNAKLSGVPVNLVNIFFTIITALTVAIASKVVGALIVSSLIVIPTATSLQIAKSYRSTILYSILFALISMTAGLIFSYYLRPGGTIALVSIIILAVVMIVKAIFKKLRVK